MLDDLLTDEERLIRDTVREFVTDNLMPVIETCNRKDAFRKNLSSPPRNSVCWAPRIPEKYGCANLGPIAYGLINQELERGDSGLRSFVSVQTSLVMYPIFAFGSEEQKDYWLPKLLGAGEKIGCFGLTEPDFGSNPGGMLTRAEDKGSYYLAERQQGVDYERHDFRCRDCVGQT
jgi:glutaryl-CoA dehydrogenase